MYKCVNQCSKKHSQYSIKSYLKLHISSRGQHLSVRKVKTCTLQSIFILGIINYYNIYSSFIHCCQLLNNANTDLRTLYIRNAIGRKSIGSDFPLKSINEQFTDENQYTNRPPNAQNVEDCLHVNQCECSCMI